MADWSSLLPDLVHRVVGCLLDTSDVDYYMDMRAVYHNWRSAMADPCSPGDGAGDLPFCPRHWVILDEDYSKEDANGPGLFLNIRTGRYLRRRVPMLRYHVLIGAPDGLLVLRTRNMGIGPPALLPRPPQPFHLLQQEHGLSAAAAAPPRPTHALTALVSMSSPWHWVMVDQEKLTDGVCLFAWAIQCASAWLLLHIWVNANESRIKNYREEHREEYREQDWGIQRAFL